MFLCLVTCAGLQCLAIVGYGIEPRIGATFFPTIAPDSSIMRGGVAIGGSEGGTVFTAAYLQCLTCGASLPNSCNQCHSFSSHSALLQIDSSTLRLVKPGQSTNTSRFVATTIVEAEAFLLHSADQYPSAAIATRKQADLSLSSKLSLVDVVPGLSPTNLQAATVSLDSVPFQVVNGDGNVLWLVATRDTTASYSFDTLYAILLSVSSTGETTVVDTITIDVQKIVAKFSSQVQAKLSGQPLDAPEIYPCFDVPNEQVRFWMQLDIIQFSLRISIYWTHLAVWFHYEPSSLVFRLLWH